ncbi:uncharacterized protein [Acropora muricata]|uniref:uncharacterized protein isoform X2 n=1 Tax=Acropora muricata TaxID=159855 RepID=UPI0034E5A683
MLSRQPNKNQFLHLSKSNRQSCIATFTHLPDQEQQLLSRMFETTFFSQISVSSLKQQQKVIKRRQPKDAHTALTHLNQYMHSLDAAYFFGNHRSSFPRNSHLLSQHSRAATTSQPWSAQWNKKTYC